MSVCVHVCKKGCQTIKWHGSSQHKNRASKAKRDSWDIGPWARLFFPFSLSVIAHGNLPARWFGLFCERLVVPTEWIVVGGLEGRGE